MITLNGPTEGFLWELGVKATKKIRTVSFSFSAHCDVIQILLLLSLLTFLSDCKYRLNIERLCALR